MYRFERLHGAMLIILLYLWVGIVGVKCQGAAGPPEEKVFVLNLVSAVEVCDDGMSAEYIDPSKIETIPVNETYSMVNGVITILKPFDADTFVLIKLEKLANGKKEKLFTLAVELCKEMNDPESDFKLYLDAMGFPRTCPFDDGTYPISDLQANLDSIEINGSTAGNYLATMTFAKCKDDDCDTNEPEFIACVTLACVIEAAD